MSKAVPWSVKGVGLEAREVAREAARRSGLSLGDWLNSVIAEQAADIGVDAEDIDEQGRLEAVTARLARLSGRVAEPAMRYRRGDTGARSQAGGGAGEETEEEDEIVPVRRMSRPSFRADVKEASFSQSLQNTGPGERSDADDLLDQAIRVLERRAGRNAEETTAALDRMGERLAGIERQLAGRPRENVDPVRRALTRLEERLEDFGRTDSKEGLDGTLRRFDRKLSELASQIEPERAATASKSAANLTQVEARIDELASNVAVPSSKSPARSKRIDAPPENAGAGPRAPSERPHPTGPALTSTGSASSRALRAGLDRAVADIARRQQDLERDASRFVKAKETPTEFEHATGAPPRCSPPPAYFVETQSDALVERVEALRKNLPKLSSDPVERRAPAPELGLLRQELASISRSLTDLAPKAEISSLAVAVRELGERVERIGQERTDHRLLAPLEALTADLRRAATEAPQNQALDAVQREISAIGARLDAMPAKALDPEFVRRILGQAQEIRDLLASVLDRQTPFATVERRLDEVGDRLERLSADASDRGALSELTAGVREVHAALERSGPEALLNALDARFAALSRKLEESPSGVEALAKVGDLDRRLDAVRHELSEKLDRRAQKDVNLLESLMRDIGVKLERPAVSAAPDMSRLESLLHDVAKKLETPPAPAGSAAIETAIRGMEAKLEQIADRSILDADALHQAVFEITTTLDRPQSSAVDAGELESLLRDIGSKLSQPAASPAEVRTVVELIGVLSEKIDAMEQRAAAPMEIATTLLEQVGRLTERIDVLHQPQAGAGAIEALRDQIRDISGRLENSDAGLRAIAQMEQSLDGLFASLSETHQSAVEAACEAAREVAANMIGAEPRSEPGEIDQDLVNLREAQNVAERRVHHTLTVVHDALEKVVDRLTAVERDLAAGAVGQAFAPAPGADLLAAGPAPVFAAASREAKPSKEPSDGGRRRRLDPAGSLAAVRPQLTSLEDDELIEPGSGFAPASRADSAAASSEPRSEQSAFIAAARRAIKLNGGDAGLDGKAADRDKRELGEAKARARAAAARLEADEIEKSPGARASRLRRYVDSRKRPILYGIAAVVLALCSLQVVTAFLDKTAAPARSKALVRSVTGSRPGQGVEAKPLAPGQSGALDRPTSDRSARAANQNGVSKRSVDASAALSSAPTSLPTFAATPSLLAPEVASLHEAAVRGDPGAQYALAIRYSEGRGVTQNPALAARWFLKAAQQNVAVAQYRAGLVYERGVGAPLDVKAALGWYLKAAEAGNVRAMHNLAVLSAEAGDDGAPDYTSAAAWFLKAARHGVRDSQYNLAILYARGLGIERSLKQAYVWFAIAANQGDADAAKKRDEVGSRLDATQIASAKATVAAFRPQRQITAANEAPAPSGLGAAASATRGQPQKTLSGV